LRQLQALPSAACSCSKRGAQPSSLRILDESQYTTAASPSRRGPTTALIGAPVTASQAFKNSDTDRPAQGDEKKKKKRRRKRRMSI